MRQYNTTVVFFRNIIWFIKKIRKWNIRQIYFSMETFCWSVTKRKFSIYPSSVYHWGKRLYDDKAETLLEKRVKGIPAALVLVVAFFCSPGINTRTPTYLFVWVIYVSVLLRTAYILYMHFTGNLQHDDYGFYIPLSHTNFNAFAVLVYDLY